MTCRQCQRDFVTDRTPMAEAGICMWCRPGIRVVCSRCGADCPGAYDGQCKCASCRDARLGEQQYEDKQRALYARLQAEGQIISS